MDISLIVLLTLLILAALSCLIIWAVLGIKILINFSRLFKEFDKESRE